MKTDIPRSVGLPRIEAEPGERRAFLPRLVRFAARVGAREIVLERGYGEAMGFAPRRYERLEANVRFGSREEALAQDLVLVLRCPEPHTLDALAPGTILVSMLHYPTRPDRVARLTARGVHGVSLDGIVDDQGKRLVENLRAVGWNAMHEAFRVLEARYPGGLDEPGRPPIEVTVLGAGAVGGHAVQAATRYGDPALRERLLAKGVPGVAVTVVDHDLTGRERFMRERLTRTDILVDATQRPDPSLVVVPNSWLAELPEHALLVDLSVDPYDLDRDPPSVKGIEGIPGGNLDQWVFAPDDPAWDALDPRVATAQRRTVLSCYAWPGITPEACMEVYGSQLQPILRVLFRTPIDDLDITSGTHHERAVARAELGRWRLANPA